MLASQAGVPAADQVEWWEDGHLGNSAALVFTASDFISNIPSRPATIGTITLPGGDLRIAENSQQLSEYIAIKVIPKGFKITTDSVLTIWAQPPGGGFVPPGAPLYQVNGQVLITDNDSTSSITSTGALTLVGHQPSVLTATLMGLPALPNGLIGNGLRQVVISFTPGVPLTVLTSSGLMGAQIKMFRI